MPFFRIRPAHEDDVGLILTFIRDLAQYERLEHAVVANEGILRETLFGQPRFAEVLFGEEDGVPVAFALFFHNFSTFIGRPGLYLEDVFVKPEKRGRGYGKAMLARLASIAVERNCGRFEWAVLDWNTPAIDFYKSLGAQPVDEWTIFRMTGNALTNLAAQDDPAR
jgi:GNAT superfamily N-acetyltransferase